VVAVNGIMADVGLMQLELTKPEVTLWVRSEVYHPSQLESEVLAEPDPIVSSGTVVDLTPATELQLQAQLERGAAPAPTFLGRPDLEPEEVEPIVEPVGCAGPRCACATFEDEEPQILMRWLVCSLLFGWVTWLPVIFMQPHEERPRQHLFRQYLLKPGVLIMPFWILLWLLDSIGILIVRKIVSPFFYLFLVHMIFPAVMVWYLFQLQAADEKLIMEQRANRQAEAERAGGELQPVAVEDASPTLLKEFITVNPVALVWLGSVASLGILASSMLTPMKTERGKLAQGFVHMIYGPLAFFQITFAQMIYWTEFLDVPRLYMTFFMLLLSIPCFMLWCCCLMCATRYGRQDMALVRKQRVERAKLVTKAPPAEELESQRAEPAEEPPAESLVDLTEAWQREWEFIFTA